MKKNCSGLGSFNPCEKRGMCANYKHWIDDPRSEFNACTITGHAFKFFVPRDAPVATQVLQQHWQGSLF